MWYSTGLPSIPPFPFPRLFVIICMFLPKGPNNMVPMRRWRVDLAACCGFLAAALSVSAMDNPYAYYSQFSNGIPSDRNFFPIGVWLQSPPNATAYKNAGINLFIGLWDGPNQSQLTGLTSAGVKTLCDQNAFGLSNVNNRIIAGWIQQDEPDNAQDDGMGGYGPPILPSVIIQRYETFKANDPSRPVFLGLGQGTAWDDYYGRGTRTHHPEDYYEYVKGCDIACFDIYPVNSSDTAVSGNLWYVPLGVDRLRACTSNAKPVFCWIECTKIDSTSAAKPTTAQVRSEVWMALIHGANGIGYFCHSWTPSFDEAALLHDSTMLAAVTALNQQIQSLAPVLNGPAITNLLTVGTSNGAVPIDAMTKQCGGTTYVFAAAMRSGTTTGTFTLPFGTNADVIGESRQITITNGTFSDTFTAYDAHLYRIASIGDNDRDGIPDWWENRYFGNTNVSHGSASDDSDADGFRDLYEYLAGTDPTNAASLFKISGLTRQGAGQLALDWQSVQSKVYSIQMATNLPGTWSVVRSNMLAAPATNTYSMTAPPTDRAFFRIAIPAY
jgi:hypothetical protein